MNGDVTIGNIERDDQCYFDGRRDERLDARVETFGALRRAADEARFWDEQAEDYAIIGDTKQRAQCEYRAAVIRFAIRRAIRSENL